MSDSQLSIEILRQAKQTLAIESQAVLSLIDQLNEDFSGAVQAILKSEGRVVMTGIGKSAIIARKAVATFNSTGTAALFMHAADAIHGDLGMIASNDVIICLSKSGTTPEIKVLVSMLKRLGNTLIAIVGSKQSFLAQKADFVVMTKVTQEACPNNLAPTASTTAQLAMCDALAVCLLQLKQFSSADFAKYHPGGTLGKRLYLRAADMYVHHAPPQVYVNTKMIDLIVEMSSKRLGATAVLDKNNRLVGIVTDGDLRRALVAGNNVMSMLAKDLMSKNPKTVAENELAIQVLDKMQQYKITQIIVMKEQQYIGMIHLHDLVKEGLI
ncbi:MAG: KpsF/GutQ family sugar-phosphate isomerase [Chitinophagales bacterium]